MSDDDVGFSFTVALAVGVVGLLAMFGENERLQPLGMILLASAAGAPIVAIGKRLYNETVFGIGILIVTGGAFLGFFVVIVWIGTALSYHGSGGGHVPRIERY
jgi:hypothetical protein